MIGIIIAMEKELAPFLAGRAYLRQEHGGKDFYSVTIGRNTCVIVQSGVGKVNAAYAATLLAEVYAPELVISTGISGGLGVSKLLSLVAADKTVQYDVDTSALGDPVGFVSTVNTIYFPTDPALTDAFCAMSGASKATLACGDRFVADRETRDFIVKTFNAGACDMESGAIGQVCRIARIRYLVVRCISDGADEDAPGSFDELTDVAAEKLCRAVTAFIKKI